jgi:hypothetical protein
LAIRAELELIGACVFDELMQRGLFAQARKGRLGGLVSPLLAELRNLRRSSSFKGEISAQNSTSMDATFSRIPMCSQMLFINFHQGDPEAKLPASTGTLLAAGEQRKRACARREES